MNKIKFIYLLILSTFILTSTAAYFSVIGMAKLFAGEFLSVVIMISGLELAKLVTASFLYRYWNDTSKIFKTYLVCAVMFIMLITSAGIYGFLSSAYSITASKLSNVDKQIEFFENKKEIIQNQVNRIKDNIDNKTTRINTLSSLRLNQETRIDTLYNRGLYLGVRRTEGIIKDANNEIEKTGKEIEDLNKVIQLNLDSVSKIDLSIIELHNNNINTEVGPLKYIAILTGKNIDSVVNFFILLLIFVFDPLAICLVIAVNKVLLKELKEKDAKPEAELKTEGKIKTIQEDVNKESISEETSFNEETGEEKKEVINETGGDLKPPVLQNLNEEINALKKSKKRLASWDEENKRFNE